MTTDAYVPLRSATSRFLDIRGLRYHLLHWEKSEKAVDATSTPLLMLHGWMDVGASFQFVVDAMDAHRRRDIYAIDWRGFGLSSCSNADSYWFPDYLGDLDAILDNLFPGAAIDLLGHSMGGNVAMIYAGVRPGRIRRLMSLEGFGMPDPSPAAAPSRYARWLDELKDPPRLLTYANPDEVAARLRKTNPRLAPVRAAWLALHWSQQRDDGRWHILGDAAHRRVNPVLYRKAEVVACWKRITAPLLWVEGDGTELARRWSESYPRSDFEARLAAVPKVEPHVLRSAGHMLHHDQPEALAVLLDRFLQID